MANSNSQDFELHKITYKDIKETKAQERPINSTDNDYQYEILFENCTSMIDIRDLLSTKTVKAESRWKGYEELFIDTISIGTAIAEPGFPESDGFKTFPYTWKSDTAEGSGELIIKLLK